MNDKRPTESQCLAAAAAYPMQRLADKNGRKRWSAYSFALRKGGRATSGSISDRVRIGALDIAAGGSRRDVNAALARACDMLWPEFGDAVFSAAVSDLALSLLRYGWRLNGSDDANFAAEVNAEVEPDTGVISDADMAWAEENNAAWT